MRRLEKRGFLEQSIKGNYLWYRQIFIDLKKSKILELLLIFYHNKPLTWPDVRGIIEGFKIGWTYRLLQPYVTYRFLGEPYVYRFIAITTLLGWPFEVRWICSRGPNLPRRSSDLDDEHVRLISELRCIFGGCNARKSQLILLKGNVFKM